MKDYEDWQDLPLSGDVKRFIDASRRWRNPQAPQLDCMVHTTIMFNGDGDWM